MGDSNFNSNTRQTSADSRSFVVNDLTTAFYRPSIRNDESSGLKSALSSRRPSIIPPPVDDVEGKTLKEIWLEFCMRTTIVGLDHILTRNNNWWRILWTMILVWGCGMAVYQSLDIIYQFYNNNGIQRVQFQINNSLRLPSVTICNNIFIDYEINKEITDKHLASLLHNFTDLIESDDFSEDTKSESLKQSILKYVGSMELPKMRQITGSVQAGIDNFFHECYIGNQYCDFQNPDDVYIFYHLSYGTCFTINPGFRRTYQADENTGILFRLSLDGMNRNKYINRNYAVFLVHEAGTAPVMYNSELVTLKDEKAIKVMLTLKEHVRSHSCIEGNDITARSKLLHYSEASPYIYSTESCIASCAILWNIKRESRIIEPNIAILKDSRFGNWTRHAFCFPPDCFPRAGSAGERMCDILCLPRCKETIITTKFVKLLKENKELEIDKRRGSHTVENQLGTLKTHLKRCIFVGYQTSMYEITSEEYKYSVADFWGIVGGNISLWIGICIISLVEIIELLILLVQAWWYNRKKDRLSFRHVRSPLMRPASIRPRHPHLQSYHFH